VKKTEVDKKFKEIVSDIFAIDVKEIKNSTEFVKDLHAKSIDMISLIAATENTFGIRAPSYEVRENKNVGQAITYIKKKIK
jgi:acyl carrier protein